MFPAEQAEEIEQATQREIQQVLEIRDRCRKAALDDVSLWSDDELLAATAACEAARAGLDATEGHLLAELDRRGSCDREVGLSTTGWLATTCRLARPTAAGRVRTATRMSRLAQADAALADGDLSFDHAHALADAASNPRLGDQLHESLPELVGLAGQVPYLVWRRMLSALVRLWDSDGSYDPDAERARNRLSCHQVGDELILRGNLVGEAALVVREAINAMADRLWNRNRNDHDITVGELAAPPRTTVQAEALVELCRHGPAESGAGPGPAVDITVVVDAATANVTTTDGDPLPPAELSHLWCDPIIHRLTVDHRGQPLDLGRAVRLATPAQRRALAVRDGGCAFPGCEAPVSWCDAHHLVEWNDGGRTDLSNLALLCRRHHGVSHRKGWTMTSDPDQGGFTWTTPAGRTVRSRSPDP